VQTRPDQSGLILVEFHGIKHPARSTYIERFPIPVARNNCGRQRRMGTYPNTWSGILIANSPENGERALGVQAIFDSSKDTS